MVTDDVEDLHFIHCEKRWRFEVDLPPMSSCPHCASARLISHCVIHKTAIRPYAIRHPLPRGGVAASSHRGRHFSMAISQMLTKCENGHKNDRPLGHTVEMIP